MRGAAAASSVGIRSAPTGIVFDIKRGSVKDGPGLRTSVFLKGCPLRCAWCHNPESQAAAPQKAVTTGEICGRGMSVADVMADVLADWPFYGADGGLTLTGGEPTAQPAFAVALAAAARAQGVKVALDTCGAAPWATFERLLPHVDLFLYDLKCMDEARHRALTGAGNARILANLRRLDAAGARLWIRCPLVPGLNDSSADLDALRAFVGGLRGVERVEACPYHALGLEKYAKFGIPVRLGRTEEPSAADRARWRAHFALLA